MGARTATAGCCSPVHDAGDVGPWIPPGWDDARIPRRGPQLTPVAPLRGRSPRGPGGPGAGRLSPVGGPGLPGDCSRARNRPTAGEGVQGGGRTCVGWLTSSPSRQRASSTDRAARSVTTPSGSMLAMTRARVAMWASTSTCAGSARSRSSISRWSRRRAIDAARVGSASSAAVRAATS